MAIELCMYIAKYHNILSRYKLFINTYNENDLINYLHKYIS